MNSQLTSSPPAANAAASAIDAILGAGVDTIYCNPGTTELPLIRELAGREDLRYVPALHESTAIAGAAGHALATGSPGVAVVHAMPGVANALNMIYNASRSHVPLVVIAGVQDLRHQFLDPMLQADVVGVLRPIVKRVWEAHTGEGLAEIVSLALRDAVAQPAGPVAICVPLNVWEMPAGASLIQSAAVAPKLGAAPPDQVERLADLLVEADSPSLLVGDVAAQRDGGAAISALAAAAAATVRWAPACSLAGSSTESPYHRGPIFPDARSFARAFADADMLLGLGAELLPPTVYEGRDLIPDELVCATLSEVPGEDTGIVRAQLSVFGDLPDTLAALERAVASRAAADPALAERIAARREALRVEHERERARLRERSLPQPGDAGPLASRVAVQVGLDAAPGNAVVVDEAISNSGWVSLLGSFGDPLSYVTLARGGGLGYALGMAAGVQVASGRPVLAFVGDGALVYGPQALWTIAHEQLPVVTCVLNNRSYAILKGFMRAHFAGDGEDGGAAAMLDIATPPVDTVAMARSYGVEAAQAGDAASLGTALGEAFASGRPWLIDVGIAGSA